MGIPGRQPVLVGRTQEQTLLRSLHAQLLAGSGSLVLISGEAGIGKSALIEDFMAHAARHGSLLLAGNSYDLTTTPPYGPWIEVVSNYSASDDLPELPYQLQPGGGMVGLDSQAALFDLAGRFLAELGSARTLLIVLEDVHWSDSASLDLLRYLARTLKHLPVMFLVTYREDEISHHHALAALLPVFVRETRSVRMELSRLDEDAVREIVRLQFRLSAGDEARLVSYLARQADGNPFFTNELLYSLEAQRLLRPIAGGWFLGDLADAGVPSLIQHIVHGRLLRLSASARSLLELASIIGFESDPGTLAELFEERDEPFGTVLQELLDQHLLRAGQSGQSVGFSHALVRQAVYEEITIVQRQRMHQQVGELLVSRSRTDLSAIANHFEMAGDGRGSHFHLAAAERANNLFAADAVIDHCTRGIVLSNRTGAELPLSLYRLRGLARDALGDFDVARQDLEVVLHQSHARGDVRGEWQALLDLSALWASRDYSVTRQYCEHAVQLARTLDDPSVVAASLNRLGNTLANTGEFARALTCHQEALDVFEAARDTVGIARTLDFTAMVHYLVGDLPLAISFYERAIPLLRQIGDRYALSSALACIAGISVGDWIWRVSHFHGVPASVGPDAATVLTEAMEIARSIDWRAGEAFALLIRGSQAAIHGNVANAFHLLHEAKTIAESIEHKHWIGHACLHLGSIHLELLDGETALVCLKDALETCEQTRSYTNIANCIGWMASAHIHTGNLSSAKQLLDDSGSLIGEPRSGAAGNILYALAEYELVQGDADAALNTVQRLRAAIPEGTEYISPWLTRLHGEVLVALGLFEPAREQFQSALAAADALGMHLIRWRILASLSRVHLALHRLEEAAVFGTDALAEVQKLAHDFPTAEAGDTFLKRATSEIPLRQPFRPNRPSLTTFAGLTPREIEVLRIVAEGLTDAEVGNRLFISTRTVSQHLRSIYSKLGVTTRTAAVRVALEHHIV